MPLATTATPVLQETTSTPPAGGPPPASPGFFGGSFSFLPIVLIFAIFWFVMIAPERKNRKKREGMLAAMKKGDRVMTSGGMYATIAAIQEDEVMLQIADGVRARFSRSAVQSVLEEPSKDEGSKGSKK